MLQKLAGPTQLSFWPVAGAIEAALSIGSVRGLPSACEANVAFGLCRACCACGSGCTWSWPMPWAWAVPRKVHAVKAAVASIRAFIIGSYRENSNGWTGKW